MTKRKAVHIIGGGTVSHVRSHLALCTPAYGTTARALNELCCEMMDELDVYDHYTKMAGDDHNEGLETNEDVAALLDELVADPATKIIFMNAAMCDFNAEVMEKHYPQLIGSEPILHGTPSGKYETRLKTKNGKKLIQISPAEKIISRIRQKRKDIFLVGFKTTCGATEDEQYIAGLDLCKNASCNLVLANDTETRVNMIITPEEARYHVTTDRQKALTNLVEMAKLRSHLTFTRSTVIAGEPVSWYSDEVPEALRKVVDFCIERKAYKPFQGATVGHFACKLSDTEFLTSKRKTNFNDLAKNGLVRIKTDGPDTVIAYGSKPSVGGQSQRIIFKEHSDYDCIVHFHCPLKEGSQVPVMSQREYECGSHECGQNTSNGLQRFGNLSAVFLDNHGPNIVFNRDIEPAEVIAFIEDNFDLDGKTGGYVQLGPILK